MTRSFPLAVLAVLVLSTAALAKSAPEPSANLDSVKSIVDYLHSGYERPVKWRKQKVFPLFRGWVNGQVVYYYDFGAWNGKLNPVYLFYYQSGDPVENQPPILSSIPYGVSRAEDGSDDYSDLKRVYKVLVPDDFRVDQARSVSQIRAAGYTIEETNLVVNYVVVKKGAKLAGDPFFRRPKPAWYKGQKVYYFDFSTFEGEVQLKSGQVPYQLCLRSPVWPQTQAIIFQALPADILKYRPWKDAVENTPELYSPVCQEVWFYPTSKDFVPDRARSVEEVLKSSVTVDRVLEEENYLHGLDNQGRLVGTPFIIHYTMTKRNMPIVKVVPGKPVWGSALDELAWYGFYRWVLDKWLAIKH